ncbi:KEOPS complex Pcc1-like subunit [Halobacteriales archaeon QS_9_68_42]|nr:MAG: KEOPS complex Pcc1-like subunit [Halobacteriales archaeon QS_1_68_44]PSQ40324.1 MAG: KEOPS complex Pcc1-like subunit [Halobacteriales archaeon QS_9_68_42]
MTDRPHAATLTFCYPDSDAAGLVAAAVSQEVGEIDGDRSAAAVFRDGAAVRVNVGADDLVALRAGLNTWSSLVEVAERSLEAVDG